MFNLSSRLSELESNTLNYESNISYCQEFIKLLSEYLLPQEELFEASSERVSYNWFNTTNNQVLTITLIPNRDRKLYSIYRTTTSELVQKGELVDNDELIRTILRFLIKKN